MEEQDRQYSEEEFDNPGSQSKKQFGEPFEFLSGVADAIRGAAEEVIGQISESGVLRKARGHRSPPAEVIEEDDLVRVMVDLPGVSLEDLDIRIEKQTLNIRATREPAPIGPNAKYVAGGCCPAGYQRSIHLPAEINPDSADATLRNGVLTVVFKKSQEAEGIRIDVRTE